MTARTPASHTCVTTSVFAVLGAMAFGACADTEEEPPITSNDSGVPPVSTMDSGVRECAIIDEGTTRACTCATGGAGTQACIGGAYQACRCTVPLPEAGAGAGNLCKAGFYSGEFKGKYKPGVFGAGIVDNFYFEVDIMGAGNGGYPALSFTLEEEETGRGSEFATFAVKNGCMVGNAQALFTNNPFVARIDGELNCNTGAFTGSITGQYDLIETGAKFNFTGPLSSQFELAQSRLNDGIWNVKEPPSLSGTPAGGGGGTWSAIWEADAPPPGEDPCANVDFGDAGTAPVPPDAATPPSADAGTTLSDAGN